METYVTRPKGVVENQAHRGDTVLGDKSFQKIVSHQWQTFWDSPYQEAPIKFQ